MARTNPFSFTPMAVSLIISIVYLSIAIPLIIIHETVPHAPSNPTLHNGLNTTEAWLDLALLTNGYHPYNSRRNDVVRDWLLRRIEAILNENEASWSTEPTHNAPFVPVYANLATDYVEESVPVLKHGDELRTRTSSPKVTIFNDMQSNVTFSVPGSIGSAGLGRRPGQSVYFESTNIMVYIRGTEDDDVEWWKADYLGNNKTPKKGGVLVNAHYDSLVQITLTTVASVSTGFGATDDGVGVITILQLIRFFTTSGNEPKKGIVALLNNGEEDFLNGARAYTQHPISRFAYTFLNLEGAGAGGRATLFRSTDAEVTKAYATTPNPFGTVVSADGFQAGVVRSQTDYVVFDGVLGLRGLDVAFWYPRARYHTDQDDARHTSVNSLWHMLQSSMYIVKALSSDTSDSFIGPRADGAKGKVKNGSGTDGVWFDIFGKGFALFGLRGLFAWSLTLLIASPLILILIVFFLIRQGKFYFFASKAPEGDERDEVAPVSLYGWRGLFRFPIAFVVASALNIGSAFLIRKINPLIVYSSHFVVWSMMLSLYFTVFWWVMRGADFMRPSALHRGYAFLWMYLMGWAFLVAATVFEDRFRIATGYLFVFFESTVFLATVISLCELFALPTKSDYAQSAREEIETREGMRDLPDLTALNAPTGEQPGEDATETTPLFGGDGAVPQRATTFANYARRTFRGGGDSHNGEVDEKHKPYGDEQGWSAKLPSWTWLLQLLLVAPILIILIGQVALLVIEGISQTGADGSSLLLPYILIAVFSIMLLLPLGPFIHRITYHIPSFLLLLFIGTLIYNLVAFPFSANNRYKAYFLQTVDLETGRNQVSLLGLEEYIRPIIASLPSAAGQDIDCITSAEIRTGVQKCSWEGLAPRVIPNVPSGVPPEKGYADWLIYNASRNPGQNSARFVISGQNTRACVLRFDRVIKDFNVLGSSKDDRFDVVPEMGSDQIRLWHRDWDRAWTVDVEWPVGDGKQPGEEGMEGKVVCLWSDNNFEGVIPALDEIRRFAPAWSAVSKAQDGLVEGVKRFVV